MGKKKETDVTGAAEDLVTDWLDALLAEGQENTAKLPPQMQGEARVALAYVAEHKDAFVGMGKAGFSEVVSLLASGAKGKAREAYIRTKLGPDGLIALMMENNEAMGAATARSKEAEQQFYDFLKALGVAGISVLRRILLG